MSGFQNYLHMMYGLPNGFGVGSGPASDNKGWYVYGPNDPKPTRRQMLKAKHVYRDDIDPIKHWKKKEEEEELILIHLRHGEWDD